MSDSSQPHGLQPTRLLRPWDFPGKSIGVGCHCLLLSQTEWGGIGGSREIYEKARGDGACDSERPVSTQLSLGRVGAVRCRRTWLKQQVKRESYVFNR